MVAVDTNILIRILVEDETQPEQVYTARRMAEKQAHLFVPVTVQLELVWVLDFTYKQSKSSIICLLKHLEENDAFTLQQEDQFIGALELFENNAVSFSDCMIYLQAKQAGYHLITFDKKFAKLPKVELLD